MIKSTVETKHKIGKTTYLIEASPSEKATITIDKKIENLIAKDMQISTVTTGFLDNNNTEK